MKKWNLNSWTKFPAKHLPVYQDKEELDLVLSKIKKLISIVNVISLYLKNIW